MLPRRRSVEVLPLEVQPNEQDDDDDQHDCSSHSRLDATHCRNSTTPSHHHETNPPETMPASRPSPFVIQVTLLAGLGGILFGYDLGVISGALPQLISTFHLSTKQSEWVVSILYLGGGLGAAVGGSLCDVCGRKQAILYTDIAFLLGALVLAVAPNFATVLLGRTIVGFAIAVSGIADVSYLHEIAPLQFRGAIVSVNEACISLGFLIAFAVGVMLSGGEQGWRAMFAISGLIALLQLGGMWNMPESPKWLMEQGRVQESLAARERIEGMVITTKASKKMDEHSESSEIVLGVPNTLNHPGYQTMVAADSLYTAHMGLDDDDDSILVDHGTGSVRRRLSILYAALRQALVNFYHQLSDFLHTMSTHYRRQATISIFLAVTQQLCGQTNVLSYAPLIFSAAARDTASETNNTNNTDSEATAQGWATLLIGLVKFAVTIVVICKIEHLGRRFLLLTGMTTIALGLLCLTLAFWDLFYLEFLALPGILLVVCGYSMSFGPLTWLLTSEVVPTDIRGRTLGASTILTYATASLVTFTFLSFQEWAGPGVVFFGYFIITVLGLVFAWLAIPDTGGKTVQEIDVALGQMRWWRRSDQDRWMQFSMLQRRKSRTTVPPDVQENVAGVPIHQRFSNAEIA